MAGAALLSGGPTASQKYATILPRTYKPDGTHRWLVWLHYAGADAYNPWSSAGAGVGKLLSRIGDRIPVLTIDGGTIPGSGADNGQFTAGNATARDRIADGVAWVIDPAKGGGKTDKVLLGGSSQGTPGIIRYARENPTKVAAMFAVLPLSDLDDIRNNNRPNGWTGTTQNAPANCDSVNAAHGLTANSTGDYPTHGTSFAALPANVSPATADLTPISGAGIPCKAWYSPTDATVPASTVSPVWVTALGGTVAAISPDSGHADASVGAVDADSVLAFLTPYA